MGHTAVSATAVTHCYIYCYFDFLISQNALSDLKGSKGNIICTMDDVQEDFEDRHMAQHQLQY